MQESEAQTLFLLRKSLSHLFPPTSVATGEKFRLSHQRDDVFSASHLMRLGETMGGKRGGRSTGWINYEALRNDISTGRSEEGDGWKEESIHPDLTS